MLSGVGGVETSATKDNDGLSISMYYETEGDERSVKGILREVICHGSSITRSDDSLLSHTTRPFGKEIHAPRRYRIQFTTRSSSKEATAAAAGGRDPEK